MSTDITTPRTVSYAKISASAEGSYLEPYIGMDFEILKYQRLRVQVKWYSTTEWILRTYINIIN